MVATVAAGTVAEVSVLTRWPVVTRHPWPALAVDLALAVAVLVLSRGGMAFFCFVVGSSALGGALPGCGRCRWGRRTRCSASPRRPRSCPPATPAGRRRVHPDVPDHLRARRGGRRRRHRRLRRYLELSVGWSPPRHAPPPPPNAPAWPGNCTTRSPRPSAASPRRPRPAPVAAPPPGPRGAARRHGLARRRGRRREARELLDGLRLRRTRPGLRRHRSGSPAVVGPLRIPVRVDAGRSDPAVEVRSTSWSCMRPSPSRPARSARHAGVAVRGRPAAWNCGSATTAAGSGCPPTCRSCGTAQHFGLIGMYERAHTIDGSLRVAHPPADGHLGEVTVPAWPASGASRAVIIGAVLGQADSGVSAA